jgi:hypothetical protein
LKIIFSVHLEFITKKQKISKLSFEEAMEHFFRFFFFYIYLLHKTLVKTTAEDLYDFNKNGLIVPGF